MVMFIMLYKAILTFESADEFSDTAVTNYCTVIISNSNWTYWSTIHSGYS